jgi:mRNA degradation ribonuclease J1/J2
VHGARQHLHNHAELARRCGIEQVLVIENGQVAAYREGQLTRADDVRAGRVAIDRGLETLSPSVLRERAALGRTGIAQLSVVLDHEGVLRCPARLSTFGVAAFEAPEASEQLAREAEELLRKQSKIWLRRGRDTALELEKFLAWRLERMIGMRPHVTVQISQI